MVKQNKKFFLRLYRRYIIGGISTHRIILNTLSQIIRFYISEILWNNLSLNKS